MRLEDAFIILLVHRTLKGRSIQHSSSFFDSYESVPVNLRYMFICVHVYDVNCSKINLNTQIYVNTWNIRSLVYHSFAYTCAWTINWE